LEGVSTLVEVSLLQPPNELGKARCSMLETIRAYAVDELRASGEEEESARRHAGFYVRLIEEAEPELTRAGQVQWVARLEDEHANLVAVLRWCTQIGDTEMGLAMAGRMWRLWQLRGHLAEGRSWLEELLALAGDAPTVPRVKGLIGLAGLQYYQGDWEGAETSYRQALDTLEDLDEWWLQIEALAGLGITIACHKGAPEEAAPVERELQALADRHQDPMAIGFAMATSAMVRLFSGDLEGSRRYNEQVLAACRAFGERWYEGETLRSLALASLLLKRYEEAEEELLAAFDIAREAGALPSVAVDLDRLAWAAMATGRPERAVVLAGAADRLRETVGSQLTAAAGDFTVEGFRWATEDPRQAARDVLTQHEIDLAWARGRSMSPDEAVECTA
jgi:non-specific serine/threonine protein kinase